MDVLQLIAQLPLLVFLFLKLQRIALGQFRAFAIQAAQALACHGGATAKLHGWLESAADRQVGPQAAHRRGEVQSVALIDVMGAPGRNGLIIINRIEEVTSRAGTL